MSRFLGSARLATLLAVASALILTSVAAGAAGAALILGQANSAGSSATSVTSSNASRTLLVQNTSATGFAVDARSTGGIGGQFLSATSTGMAGYTSANNRFAVVGTHNGTAFGNGAAILGDGRQNTGISGTTAADDADAVRGINVATSAAWLGGLYANGVYGETRATDGNGVYGVASAATGVNYGVWGRVDSPDGVGVVGQSDGAGLAGAFYGDMEVSGSITVGSCTGCGTTTLVAQAAGALSQGDPVAIEGVTTDASGATILLVRAASASDRIIGVADSTVTYRETARGGTRRVVGAAGASNGALLTVVTRGLLEMAETATTRGLAAGTALSVNTGGKLASANPDGVPVAFVAGSLATGEVVVFVNP